MTSNRFFTLEEANALIPALDRIVARQMAWESEIEGRLRSLAKLTGSAPRRLSPADDDSPEVQSLKADLAERIGRYQKGWEEVTTLGAIVKDTRLGLVDFYGRLDGRTVWLCWKYGEARIEFFHELDSGFSARKPLSPDARHRLLN
jgi:hypothetical protein